MEVQENTLGLIYLFGILLIYQFSNTGATEIDVNITIGLPTPPPPPPPQVPWTGPLKTCDLNVSDTLLGDCLASGWHDIRRSWVAGIPSIGIPPMDPFTFDKIQVDACSPTLDFDGNFTSISITGFNNFTNLKYGLNSTGGNITYEVTIPKLRLDGHYKACGRVILSLLPISGEGPFYFEFYNFKFFGSAGLRTDVVGNETVLAAYNVVSDFTIDDYAFELKNFGGTILGPAINTVAYASRSLILDSIKGEMNQKNAELLGILLNSILPTQPYLSGMLDAVRCSQYA